MKQQNVKYDHDNIFWYFNGKHHRNVDLPAYIYFKDGNLCVLEYYEQDRCHRANGPAIINFKFKMRSYYYFGVKYSSLKEMQMMKACK